MEIINAILVIVLFIIINQITTIFHELGHAIPALIFTKDTVKLILGKDISKTKIISVSRLNIELRGFSPSTGFVYWNAGKMTKSQKLVATTGGPLVSLIIGVSLIFFSGAVNDYLIKQIMFFSALYNLFEFITTSIPVIYPKWWGEYGGFSSDGYKVLSLIKTS
jgi:hypothetical protein